MKRILKIMVTGHRPNKLGGYDDSNPTRTKLINKFKDIISEYKNQNYYIIGISGGAIGTDQDFIKACIDLKVKYHVYVPFEGQESIWPMSAQRQYRELLNGAQEIKIISPGAYAPNKMQIRNIAMANDCALAIAVWDGTEKGGTYNCHQYLEKIYKPIIRINPKNL